MLRILVVGLVLLVAVLFALPRPSAVAPLEVATWLPDARPLPRVALIDHRGRPFDWSGLDGRFTWLFFGFSHCPDVCPLTLATLARARAELATRNPGFEPALVFVSVDPARDTPERLARYVQSFDTALIGATASDAVLAPLLAALGVAVVKHEHDGASYSVTHNGTIYVIGPRAELLAVSSPPHDAAILADDLVAIARRHRTRAADAPRP